MVRGPAKKVLAVLLGALAGFAVLGAVEFLLRIHDPFGHPAASYRMTAGYIRRDPVLGFRFAPQATATVEKIQGSTVVYSATYRSDRYGRRITPMEHDVAPEKFAVFFGDSMTFGEGLQSDETLPFFFALRARGIKPYNYAFPGYGPQQMYVQTLSAQPADELTEKSGIAIFGYFDYLINRVVGSTEVLRWNPGYHPYFRLQDGKLVRAGDFRTGRSTLTALYDLFNQCRLCRALGLELPVLTASHRRLLCEIVYQSQQEFERRFPGSRFVVALYPLSAKRDDIVQSCLEPNRIAYVDLRDAFGAYGDPDLKNNPYRLGDGHYSPAGAALVAESLYNGLVRQKYLEP